MGKPMTDLVIVRDADGVRIVRMNRPDKKNALTARDVRRDGARDRNRDRSPASAASSSAAHPGAFSAGNDLQEFLQAAAEAAGSAMPSCTFLHALARRREAAGRRRARASRSASAPRCCCTATMWSPATDARFSTPFVRLGLVPEAASSLMAPRLMGHRRAFALLVDGHAARRRGRAGAAALSTSRCAGSGRRAAAIAGGAATSSSLPPEARRGLAPPDARRRPERHRRSRIDERGEACSVNAYGIGRGARGVRRHFLHRRTLNTRARYATIAPIDHSGFSPASISLRRGFEERRQHQLLAELVHRLVGREARAVGRDLEQDAVRLAEIEAAEIEAVDLAAVRNAQLAAAARPRRRIRVVGVRNAT